MCVLGKHVCRHLCVCLLPLGPVEENILCGSFKAQFCCNSTYILFCWNNQSQYNLITYVKVVVKVPYWCGGNGGI